MAEPKPDVLQPYAPNEPAPKGWTLHDALKYTKDEDGRYHCDKLTFENKKEYDSFRSAQLGIGGTKEQLAILHQVETTGKLPGEQPLAPAPPGTTVDQLLAHPGKPDEKGFYHLGTLRVQKDEFEKFSELQKNICGKNPEGLAALYHMEHAGDRPVTFRVSGDNDRDARYDLETNTIHANPNSGARDKENGAMAPPGTIALHEEVHWAGRNGLPTLKGIPYGALDDAEEARVVNGAEARDMEGRGLPKRQSHDGYLISGRGIDSVTPAVSVTRNGVERDVKAPFEQSGRVVEMKDGKVTLAVRGDGTHPDHQMTFKQEELGLAMGQDAASTSALLRGAMNHKDTMTFKLTNDGRMVYENPAQERRLHDHPQGVSFPEPMTNPGAAAAAPRVPAGVER